MHHTLQRRHFSRASRPNEPDPLSQSPFRISRCRLMRHAELRWFFSGAVGRFERWRWLSGLFLTSGTERSGILRVWGLRKCRLIGQLTCYGLLHGSCPSHYCVHRRMNGRACAMDTKNVRGSSTSSVGLEAQSSSHFSRNRRAPYWCMIQQN